MTAPRILRIDASMRTEGSTTRDLADRLVVRLAAASGAEVTRRDLAADPVPPVDASWIAANFTDPAERTDDQRAALALSDRLVDEIRAADTLVLAVPIYNFGVPAAFKAWIDQVARARVTFRYTPDGPVGLLTGKTAHLVIASGGTGVDSAIDFATPWIRHVLGFIGITDVRVIAADRQGLDAPAALARAEEAIARAA